MDVGASNASSPDLDWSQVRETILMLNLSIAQIEIALHDSSISVGELTDSVTSISGLLGSMQEVSAYLPDTPVITLAKTEMAMLGSGIGDKVEQAIMAFQFYDLLSQRLSQVCRNLDDLGVLVSDPVLLYNPCAWIELQKKVRSKYVTEDDRYMFDKLLETRDVRMALNELKKRKLEHQPDGDIELF